MRDCVSKFLATASVVRSRANVKRFLSLLAAAAAVLVACKAGKEEGDEGGDAI